MAKEKSRVPRPVYFNLNDPREKELNDWIERKFTSFGGLVKDLLYLQMQREKGFISDTSLNEITEGKNVKNKNKNKKHTEKKSDDTLPNISNINVNDIEC